MNSKYADMPNKLSNDFGKLLIEMYSEEDSSKKESFLKEGFTFREDNTLSNNPGLFTTKLAEFIWYKSYDKFERYFDMVWNTVPEDFGGIAGAGVYKVPKIYGAKAAVLLSGEVVDWTNDSSDSVTLITKIYAVGTRFNRQFLNKASKGVIDRFLTEASNAVLRAICVDIVEGMAAVASVQVTGGLSWDNILSCVQQIKDKQTTDGVLFGFEPDFMAVSNVGMKVLKQTDEYKRLVEFKNMNAPRDSIEAKYLIWDGLKIIEANLLNTSVTIGGSPKLVHAIIGQRDKFFTVLRETEVDTYDQILPGTPGDHGIVTAIDVGMVAMATEAAGIITA